MCQYLIQPFCCNDIWVYRLVILVSFLHYTNDKLEMVRQGCHSSGGLKTAQQPVMWNFTWHCSPLYSLFILSLKWVFELALLTGISQCSYSIRWKNMIQQTKVHILYHCKHANSSKAQKYASYFIARLLWIPFCTSCLLILFNPAIKHRLCLFHILQQPKWTPHAGPLCYAI